MGVGSNAADTADGKEALVVLVGLNHCQRMWQAACMKSGTEVVSSRFVISIRHLSDITAPRYVPAIPIHFPRHGL